MICSWILHSGSGWMPNLFVSSEIGSQWWTILGHPKLTECMGICILSLAHGSEQRVSDVNCILWKTDLEIKKKIQPGYMPLDGLCLEFLGDFSNFFRGICGQIIYREYIVFRGSNISCSLAFRQWVLVGEFAGLKPGSCSELSLPLLFSFSALDFRV